MKIVLDTNVLLAGVFTRGVCESLLNECLGTPTQEVFACEQIFSEFERNARVKFRVPPEKIRRAFDFLREQIDLVVPTEVPHNACRDSDDLAILGTAVAAHADVLVTGDRDLLSLNLFQGCPTITPRSCLAQIIHSRG